MEFYQRQKHPAGPKPSLFDQGPEGVLHICNVGKIHRSTDANLTKKSEGKYGKIATSRAIQVHHAKQL